MPIKRAAFMIASAMAYIAMVSAVPLNTENLASTNTAASYVINTSALPGLDAGLTALPQWSGLMPVGGANTLFFWYVQAANASSNNLIFWHNGGPGCSSMEGLFEENGPYHTTDGGQTWQMNPNSWHNFGHVVYIDQPFGTGFSTTKTSVPNEDVVGTTMLNFYASFFAAFSGMQSKNMYITGESYAGRYIPYMAKHVQSYNAANPTNKYNLKAIGMGDAYIDTSVNNNFVYYIPYLQQNPWIYGNSNSFLTKAKSYVSKALTTSNCETAQSDTTISSACSNLENQFYNSMPAPSNPPLDDSCTDPNGNPIYFDPYKTDVTDCNFAQIDLLYAQASWEYYLNLPAVQAQIHIKPPVSYSDCNSISGGIYSSDPSTVPKYFIGSLIDAGLKVVLYTGLLDTVVPHTLTEAAISYMTWGGTKGFTSSSFTTSDMTPILTGSTQTGRYHTERNLTYVIVNNAGHMVPRDDPVTASWMLQHLIISS
ncbi:peptidase S10, serine carboxypeptidase [Dissophora ornata]|nr:Cell death protease [Dissophora ornata]KAI8595642.1 peptidase S10, serine carboxypeptidase [Dissophora ornata]